MVSVSKLNALGNKQNNKSITRPLGEASKSRSYSITIFTITVQFLARWLARFYHQFFSFTRTCTRCTKQMSYLYASDLPFKNFFYFRNLTSSGSCYFKKQNWHQTSYASVLLFKMNFVITLSKFATEPLACGSWFHGVMTHLSSIRGQTHTDPLHPFRIWIKG